MVKKAAKNITKTSTSLVRHAGPVPRSNNVGKPSIVLKKTTINGKNYYFPVASFDPNNKKDNDFLARNFRDAHDITKSIAPVQFPRIRIDLGLWREGILEAELPLFPFRTRMQQIYQDLILDGHIEACMRKRRNLTLLKEPCFYKSDGKTIIENIDGAEVDKTNDFINKMINSDWWFKLIRFMLDAEAYGYQLISLGDMKEFTFPDISIVRRQNISPDRHVVSPVVNMLSGTDFLNPDDKDENGESFVDWHIWVPTENEVGMSSCGYGYLYKCATYGLYIRNLLGSNADFIEVFGQPIRVVKTDKKSSDERTKIERDLQNMGSLAYMILDSMDEFTLEQSNSIGNSYKIYQDFESRCKKYISAIILGHEDAMASQAGKLGGTGGSKSSTNGDKQDSEIQKSLAETEAVDTKKIIALVNNIVLPKLRNLGLPIPENITYGYRNNDELDEQKKKDDQAKDATASWILKMSQAGYQVSPDQINDLMGITVTEAAPQDDEFSEEVQNRLKNIYARVR